MDGCCQGMWPYLRVAEGSRDLVAHVLPLRRKVPDELLRLDEVLPVGRRPAADAEEDAAQRLRDTAREPDRRAHGMMRLNTKKGEFKSCYLDKRVKTI